MDKTWPQYLFKLSLSYPEISLCPQGRWFQRYSCLFFLYEWEFLCLKIALSFSAHSYTFWLCRWQKALQYRNTINFTWRKNFFLGIMLFVKECKLRFTSVLSLRRAEFDPRSLHMNFMMDKKCHWGQSFSEYYRFFCHLPLAK